MIAVDLPSHALALTQREILVSEEPRVRLSVIEAGSREAPVTIVFLHGFGGWKEQFVLVGHSLGAALVERVAELIPNAEQIVITSSDHMLMAAAPEAVNEALSDFLGIPCASD